MRHTIRRAVALLTVGAVLASGGSAGAIVDGTEATAGQWPSMVAVSTSGEHLCGGSLVATDWVLSAATCFMDFRDFEPSLAVGPFEVTIGALDLSSEPAQGETREVAEVVIHPGYDWETRINDIALARLAAPSTAALQPLADGTPSTGSPATVAGYGLTGFDDFGAPTVLRHVDIPLLEDAACSETSGDTYDALRMLCAGAPGTESDPGPDACFGDEGGPLVAPPPGGLARFQIGVSITFNCGVDVPGRYTDVTQYRTWIDGILAGGPTDADDPANPAPPRGAEVEIVRVADEEQSTTEAISQAAAASRYVFEAEGAQHAVLARSDVFADALGGAILAGGFGPLLYTGRRGGLPADTEAELVRVLAPDSIVYVLGGPAAIPESIDQEIRDLGFLPIRLAGENREETAVEVAEEAEAEFGIAPTVLLATSGNWPDAVTAGQLSVFWGMPVLLTPPDFLHPATAAALNRLRPDELLVLGGTAAISEATLDAAREASRAGARRLAGADRMGTAAEVLAHHLSIYSEFQFGPDSAIVVNLRRDDAWAHVLSSSVLTARQNGVYVPVEGLAGDTLSPQIADGVCGLDLEIVVAGQTDVVKTAATERVRQALLGESC